MRIRLAIQGVRGAFHQEVARIYFKQDVDIVECIANYLRVIGVYSAGDFFNKKSTN